MWMLARVHASLARVYTFIKHGICVLRAVCMSLCIQKIRNTIGSMVLLCYFDGAFATLHAIQEHFLYTTEQHLFISLFSFESRTLATDPN